MSARVVEVVFVIDASDSMRPCFDALTRNLESLLKPLQGFNYEVRLGLVALNVGTDTSNQGRVFGTWTMVGTTPKDIYTESNGALFTTSPDAFLKRLRDVTLQGDEHALIALDMALDHPFSPVATTRRVVALFADERIEDGALAEGDVNQLPALLEKISARRILVFGALPASPMLDELASADRSQFEPVNGGDGLASVDFSKLLGQMAKSISVASLQGNEEPYARALWEQDRWGTTEDWTFQGLK